MSEADIREIIEYLETEKFDVLFPSDEEDELHHWTQGRLSAYYMCLDERMPPYTPVYMFDDCRREYKAGGGVVWV